MRDEDISQFRQTLRGRLITRSDPDYDEARALYNGMIDKRPLLIARCVDVADVIAAVNFGRDKACSSPSAAAATTDPDSAASTTGWSSTCR